MAAVVNAPQRMPVCVCQCSAKMDSAMSEIRALRADLHQLSSSFQQMTLDFRTMLLQALPTPAPVQQCSNVTASALGSSSSLLAAAVPISVGSLSPSECKSRPTAGDRVHSPASTMLETKHQKGPSGTTDVASFSKPAVSTPEAAVETEPYERLLRSACASTETRSKLQHLETMGYTNETFNAVLLEMHNGDVEKVLQALKQYYKITV